MATTHFSGPVVSANGLTASAGGLTVSSGTTAVQALTCTTCAPSTSLTVGASGSAIKQIKTGTVAIDLADTADGDVSAAATATITGVAAGDIVIMVPPAADLTAGLMAGVTVVTSANTVSVRIVNGSGGNVNENSANWTYLWFDLT